MISIGALMMVGGMLAGGIPGAVIAASGVLVMFAHALK